MLSDLNRTTLESLLSVGSTALQRRARIVLALAEPGASDQGVASLLGVSRPTVARWRRGFAAAGPAGLRDADRCGRPPRISRSEIERAVLVLWETAPPGTDHWTTRSLGRQAGLSQTTASRIWRALAELPPPPARWHGPGPTAPVRDIVGLFLHPSAGAAILALSLDGRPRRHARRAGPVSEGHVERHVRECLRCGVVEKLGKLAIRPSGPATSLPGSNVQAFLDDIARSVPVEFPVVFVALDDRSSPHRRSAFGQVLERAGDRAHAVPSWLEWFELVSWWYQALTARHLRQGPLRGTAALKRAIDDHLAAPDPSARPFAWT